MRKVGLALILVVSTLLLTSCYMETARKYYIHYIGKYDEKYYFQKYNRVTKESELLYLNDDKFVIVDDLDKSSVIGLVNNEALLKQYNRDKNVVSYYWMHLDTLETRLIDLDFGVGDVEVKFMDDKTIVFKRKKTLQFIVYDHKQDALIDEVSFSTNSLYRDETVYYKDKTLYVDFKYSDWDSQSDTYDFIYYVDRQSSIKVRSYHYGIIDGGNRNFHLYRGNKEFEINGFWIENKFESPVYQRFATISLNRANDIDYAYDKWRLYNDTLILNQTSSRSTIKVYNQDYQLEDSYEDRCDYNYSNIIGEDELLCTKTRSNGALIRSEAQKIIIYNFKTGEIIEESDWVTIESQIEYLRERKEDTLEDLK